MLFRTGSGAFTTSSATDSSYWRDTNHHEPASRTRANPGQRSFFQANARERALFGADTISNQTPGVTRLSLEKLPWLKA